MFKLSPITINKTRLGIKYPRNKITTLFPKKRCAFTMFSKKITCIKCKLKLTFKCASATSTHSFKL